jgi:hypothetical protein
MSARPLSNTGHSIAMQEALLCADGSLMQRTKSWAIRRLLAMHPTAFL